MKRLRVVHLLTAKKGSGGNIYARYLDELSCKECDFETAYIVPKPTVNRFAKFMAYMRGLKQMSQRECDMAIRHAEACFFMHTRYKNIVLFHHYDPAPSSLFVNIFQRLAYWQMMKSLDRIDTLVVVSSYWKVYFQKRGFDRVEVVYNPFEVDKYLHCTEKMQEDFRKKYALEGKPIVYIGNPQRAKGTDKTYEALKELDVYLVTTGSGNLHLPIPHLNLSFEEYIVLLHTASVSVFMSQIHEGWHRGAHESILCRTPVIGSGKGGMGELMHHTQQRVCDSFDTLKGYVVQALESPTPVSKEAWEYAKGFDLDRFYTDWKRVIAQTAKRKK